MTPGDEKSAAVQRRALELFEEIVDLPLVERRARLAEACADDEVLFRAVSRILERDREASRHLDPPSPDDLIVALEGDSLLRSPRRLGGSFTLRRIISVGGMGVVWLARQDRPERDVAIKLMRQGFESENALRRFRYESEILGRLDHEGIARIFEAGVHTAPGQTASEGTPWFAMEHVEGALPLTDHAEREQLSIDARVRLFLEACAAVHHGHQRGVIHRDLKPANLLVGFSRKVKVIDFGASLLQEGLEDLTAPITEQGQLLGTLRYMSPELLTGELGEASVQSDVYALGVVLYELLCRRTPFEISGHAASSILHVLRDTPPLLPRAANPELSADLEAVILKCLEKDAGRRYESIAELGRDLSRYLAREPVQARPATTVYRLRLYLRRHRLLLAATAAVLLVALVGTVVSWRFGTEALRNEQEARWLTVKSNLTAASAALSSGDVAVARRELDAVPEDQRGFFWWHLDLLMDPSVRTLHTYSAPQTPSAFSPDGEMLLCVTGRSEVSAFELTDGSVVWSRVLRVPDGPCRFNALAFNPEGTSYHTVTNKTSRLFATETGECEGDRFVTLRNLGSVELTRQDRIRLYHDRHKTIYQVRREDWEQREAEGQGPFHVKVRLGRTAAATVDEGGLYVATGGLGGDVHLHDPTGSHEPERLLTEDGIAVSALRFDASATRLAVGKRDGSVMLLDLEGEVLWREREHFEPVTSVGFDPEGARLFSTSTDGSIRTWDARTGRVLDVFLGHQEAVVAARFRPDGEHLVSASADRTVRIWRQGRDGVLELWSHRPHVGPLATRGDDTLYVASYGVDKDADGGKTGSLQRFDLTGAMEPVVLGETRREITEVLAVPDTPWVFTRGEVGDVRRWDDRDAGASTLVISWEEDCLSIAIAGDGESLLCAMRDGTLRRIDVATASEIERSDRSYEGLSKLATCTNGRWIAVGRVDGTVQLVSEHTGEVDRTLRPGLGAVCAMAWSRDGETLAVSTEAGVPTIRLFSMSGSETPVELVGHQLPPTSLAFHPDGTRLISASMDGRLHLWDVTSGRELVMMSASSKRTGVAWAPGGSWLASGGREGQCLVRFCRTAPDRHALAALRESCGREEALDSLNRRTDLDPVELERARAQVESAPQSATQVAIRAWGRMLPTHRDPGEYRRGVREARFASQLDPESALAWTALALGHYREGCRQPDSARTSSSR